MGATMKEILKNFHYYIFFMTTLVVISVATALSGDYFQGSFIGLLKNNRQKD
jgi:uncharacterized membrane protein